MTGRELLEELSRLADENCKELDKPLHILLRHGELSFSITPKQIKVYKDKISKNTGIFIE